MASQRLHDLGRFYAALQKLEEMLGGARTLAECSGKLLWPRRGVYFFMEHGERRTDSGNGPRIVRVGTHALKAGSRTLFWTRLSQHRGQIGSGGGNHRGSIFRLLVGTALVARGVHESPSWGKGNSASGDVRAAEISLERDVSNVIRAMPFLWLGIDDEPGPESLRGFIERNSIALLSNFNKPPLDPPSQAWLGLSCDRLRVRQSGLWNSNHVEEAYDPGFLPRLEEIMAAVESTR
jgi:hypothetical protein